MSYPFSPAYPTEQHEAAAHAIVAYFAERDEVAAVLLTCSCARGKATSDSCLDMAILLDATVDDATRKTLDERWQHFHATTAAFQALRQVGRFSHVDLDFVTCHFSPADHEHGWTSGPDAFELEIGNVLVYSVPLWERNDTFRCLRSAWLPYYDDALRTERLQMVRTYCLNNLAHIDLYVPRGLYFQAMQRLWHATGEFLQALFIARRTYPIAYDKWVREQVVEILELPDLYAELTSLFEIENFESDALIHKAEQLRQLIEIYIA